MHHAVGHRSISPVTRVACIAALIASAVGPGASAGGTLPALGAKLDPLTVEVTLNQSVSWMVPLTAHAQPNGNVLYSGTSAPAGAGYSCTIALTLDADPTDQARLSGTITTKNLSSVPQDYEIVTRAPICPQVVGETLAGASVQLQLVTSTDGGMLSVPPGDAGARYLVDEVPIAANYSYPFFMQGSGAGTVTVLGSFGLPAPSQPAPPLLGSFGVRQRFTLTPDDTARLTLVTYIVKPADPATVVGCDRVPIGPCDIFQGGAAGFEDALLVLATWGPCATCEADFTGDGVVDFEDLLVVLSCIGAGE